MPQIINTNIASLNAQRNLNKSQSANQTSLERLSSGLRINSAKDDAAGLAISTRFNSQIRGLNVAVRNAGDGISLAQTAEGALGSMNDNLQRVRELAVQSANATNSDVDREAIQAEVSQLLSEVSRTAEETDFNGRKLLDGSFNGTFQIGANAGQTLDVSIAELTSDKLGASDAVGISSQGSDDALQNGDLIINGVAVPPSKSSDDTASTDNQASSSIAKAAAINSVYDQSGVKAVVNENTVAGSEMVGAAGSGSITLNGVNIDITTTTSTTQTRAGVVEAINAASEQTGVTAINSDADIGGVTLVSEDGRNIELSSTLSGASTGLAAADTYEGGFTLVANGDVKEVVITGGDGTGNGDLKNSGINAGSYSTTQAQLSTSSVSKTDGVDLSASFAGTDGIELLGSQFVSASAGVAADAFNMAASGEVITVTAGSQSVDISSSGTSAITITATGGFGADSLAEALDSLEGIEASAETKLVLSGFTSGAAATSGTFEFYDAGSTAGTLLGSVSYNSSTTTEDLAASINALGSTSNLVAEWSSAASTITVTDVTGNTIKTWTTGAAITIDVATVDEAGNSSVAGTVDSVGIISVGYINETNITDEALTEISISSNFAAGDGAATYSLGNVSTVFATVAYSTSGTPAAGGNAVTATITPSLTGLTDGDLNLNGVAIQEADPLTDTASATVASDGSKIQTSSKLASAIATAEAINSVSEETGVTAVVDDTRVVGGDDTTEASALASSYQAGDSGKLYINGVDIGIISVADDGSGGVDVNASRAFAIDAINSKAGQTGVTAADNGSSITMTADDGRNISVAVDNDEANNQGTGQGFGVIFGLDASIDGIGEADIGSAVTANTTGTRGTASEGATYETTYGTLTLQSAKQIDIGVSSGGKDELEAMGLTAGKFGGGENGQFLTEIDVSTFEGATAALTAIDNAIGSIAGQRADLGALQNRIESTVSNLAITSENLSAANSRIQDADFAAETAELSRTQVLQQAGISILSQANQGPQQVLSLLG
jgi:flagellin